MSILSAKAMPCYIGLLFSLHPYVMISCVSPQPGANTADGDVRVGQGQLGWFVDILARRPSPGSTIASNSVRVVASMITVKQESFVTPNIARASWLLPSRTVIWLTGDRFGQPYVAHRCPLAGSRDTCLGINGRRSQGTRCATLPYMDPTRPASLSPTISTAYWMMLHTTAATTACSRFVILRLEITSHKSSTICEVRSHAPIVHLSKVLCLLTDRGAIGR